LQRLLHPGVAQLDAVLLFQLLVEVPVRRQLDHPADDN
jgi:hypothetical protein